MAFPELKRTSAILMQELAQVEGDIAARQEQFNSTVRAYNVAITQFQQLIAGAIRLSEQAIPD